MSKPRVFVTRIIPEVGLTRMQEFCDVTVWEDELPPAYDVLLEKAAGMDGLLSLLTDRIDAGLMDAVPGLQVISQYAVGFDNIDTAAATARGIPVGHTPGVLTDTTADFAFSLLMSAARRIVEAQKYVEAGKWQTWGPTLLMGQDVYGATLGIIGMGRIGFAVAERALGFNMRVIYADEVEVPAAAERGMIRKSVDEVLAESDFLSLHTPLTSDTRHMLNADAFKKMKSTCVLINTARGPIVDPAALYDALANGEIAYAALDVTDPEPISPDDPLLTLDNCIIAPHIASSSIATRSRMAVMAADNLLAGLKGERLPHCANPAVYDK
jgi:glyoxylate reductase